VSASEHADVFVIGLGPAGACAAAEAARRGCRVVAVDRRHEPGRPVQCAEFVPALIGMEVEALAHSVQQPIRSMMTFVEEEAPDVRENFPGTMLDRAMFDAALVEQAKRAGVTCAFGVSVRHLSRKGEIGLSDGRAVSARVIVGADGPRSLAGRAIGRSNVALVETRQITVALLSPYEATDIFLSRAIPGGYGWLFPKGKLANLGAGIEPAHKARLKTVVDELHHSLAGDGRVGVEVLGLTGGLIPVGGMLEPWGRLGATLVLLAGDAAGLTNAITGAGIAAAVHSGKLAGEAASLAVAGDAFAARDYEDELRSVFGAALERARRRREELASALAGRVAAKAALRRGWIAYPEYWAP
jgi:digeranylgeranylglycerophospholipid reductase